jgi:Protein of unknown function (DUF2946)
LRPAETLCHAVRIDRRPIEGIKRRKERTAHKVRQALSSEVRQALRTLALWLGVLALTLQGFTPLCLAATSKGASASGNSIIICTAHGFEHLTIDADGKPVPGGPQSGDSSSTCSLCAGFHLAGGFVPPLLIFTVIARASEVVPLTIASVPVPPRRFQISYITRAPPASAETTLM